MRNAETQKASLATTEANLGSAEPSNEEKEENQNEKVPSINFFTPLYSTLDARLDLVLFRIFDRDKKSSSRKVNEAKTMMNISREQRALMIYILGNFGTGMIFMLLLSPQLFIGQILAYYILFPMGILEIVLMLKINFDGFKYGLIEGMKRNSKNRTVHAEQIKDAKP